MQPGGARDQNSDQDKLFSEPAPPPGDHVGSDDLQGLTLNPSASTWAPDAAQAQPAGFHQEDDHAPRWQATEAPAPPPQPGRGRRGGLSNALEGGPQPPRARGRGGAAVNANWLLNVRGYQGSSESSSSSRPRRGRGGGGGPKRPARPAAPFDRDLFVLANSRFLVG